jgi:hypothetical protein
MTTEKYLDELVADIMHHYPDITIDDLPRDKLTALLTEAHKRRQAFAAEMAAGQTERARMARAAIGAAVYGGLKIKEAKRKAYDAAASALDQCEQIAGNGR